MSLTFKYDLKKTLTAVFAPEEETVRVNSLFRG